MPQPSTSGQPVRRWKALCSSTGSGAPPEPQNLSDFRSCFSTPGTLRIAEHRRHAGEQGDALGGDVLHRGFRVEAQVHHELRAEAQPEQHVHRERVDVEQRQHHERALAAFLEDLRLAHLHRQELVACRGEVRVREHRALGLARGAAGVLQHRERLAQVPGRMTLVLAVVVEQLGEAHVLRVLRDRAELARLLELRAHRRRVSAPFGDVADDELPEARAPEHARHLRVERGDVERDEDVGLAVLDLVLEDLLGVERRIVHHHPARLEHAEEGDEVVRRVREIQAHVHAGLHAQALETARRAVGERAELPVGIPAPHELERRIVGPALRGFVEQRRNGKQRDVGVPAHAFGIRLDPRGIGHGALRH